VIGKVVNGGLAVGEWVALMVVDMVVGWLLLVWGVGGWVGW
jgi:hypothetical protein